MSKRLKKLKFEFLKVSVASLILAIPLYPKFPLLRVPGSQVSIRLEDFLIVIISLIWIWNVFPKPRKILTDRINIAIFIFLTAGLISLLSAVFVTFSVDPRIGFLHWARRVEYMIPFFVGLSAIKSKEDLAFYIKCLVLVSLYAFIFGIGQKYFAWPVITTQNYEYAKGIALRYVSSGHLVSTFAGHYDMASYFILILPTFFILFFGPRNALNDLGIARNIKVARALVLSVILMGFWLLVNSASRISVISFLGSASFSLLLIKKKKYIPLVLAVGLIFIGFSSNLMGRYTRIFDVTIRKVVPFKWVVGQVKAAESVTAPVTAPSVVFEDRSTSIRFKVEWPRATRSLKKNPLLGTGYSSLTLATDNDYLRMLGEVGILGFSSFLLVIYRILYKLTRCAVSTSKFDLANVYILGILASVPGIMLNMVFIDIMEASKFAISFWLLAGISLSSIKLAKNE